MTATQPWEEAISYGLVFHLDIIFSLAKFYGINIIRVILRIEKYRQKETADHKEEFCHALKIELFMNEEEIAPGEIPTSVRSFVRKGFFLPSSAPALLNSLA